MADKQILLPVKTIRGFLGIFVVAALALASCRPEKPAAGRDVVLEGRLEHFRPGEVLRVVLPQKESDTALDSAAVKPDGSFTINLKAPAAGIYFLKNTKGGAIPLILVPGDTIRVNADAGRFGDQYSLEGSPDCELLLQYRGVTSRRLRSVDSLGEIFKQSQDLPGFFRIRAELDSAYRRIVQRQRNYVTGILDSCPSSLASLFILNQYFGRTRLLDWQTDLEWLLKADSGLMARFPGNSQVLEYHREVMKAKEEKKRQEEALERLRPGNPAPEIGLKTADGREVRLSSLKGKVILVDFWSAQFGLCRRENLALKNVYPKYRARGFEILAVNLDQSRDMWLAAVRLDGIPCIHVNDSRGFKSEVASTYNIGNELPVMVLIDRNGKITAIGKTTAEVLEHLDRIL